MTGLKFKTERIAGEWKELVAGTKGFALIVPVVLYIDYISRTRFGKGVVLTSILRTQAEQEAICRKIDVAPYRSTHEFWRAADIRWSMFTMEEIHELERAVNWAFTYGRGKSVLRFHMTGTAPHLHAQVPAGASWKG